MSLQQQLSDEDVEWRRYEHDDRLELVVDFGPGQRSSADVVGDTVIVVDGEDQYEFEVDDEARAFMTNGVLTIEVSK